MRYPVQGMVDIFTDSWFAYGHHRTVDYLTKFGVPVFQYFFGYEGQVHVLDAYGINGTGLGVPHAEELIYFWEPVLSLNEGFGPYPLTGNDLIMRDILVSAWTNFAKFGDPTPPDSGFEWQPQKPNSEHLFWYISSLEPSMGTSKDIEERWTLWNNLLGKTSP